MLPRIVEPEVMDSARDAVDYDSMDHAEVNRVFVDDLLAVGLPEGEALDLGTGTAQIPIELCRRTGRVTVLGIDLAQSMLDLGLRNVRHAGLADRIRLQRVDAKRLPFPDGRFAAVISNSIVHHIPEPRGVLAEALRVLAPGGLAFVRDLMRPADELALERLVATYAVGANERQRQLFADSLRAALTVEEMRERVVSCGYGAATVRATSDRHWTICARKPAAD